MEPTTDDSSDAGAPTRRRRARATPENSISLAARAAEPVAPATSSQAHEASSGQRTFEFVPRAVNEHYDTRGNKYFLPNGEFAFEHRPEKLTTRSDDPRIVRDMLLIARANDLAEVKATGAEQFRRTVWQEAQHLGIRVQGYVPTPEEQQQMTRAIEAGARAQRAADRRDRAGAASPAAPTPQHDLATMARTRAYAGELVAHGAAPYRGDPKAEQSYFVTLRTARGEETVWDAALERTFQKSKSSPQVGDSVVIRHVGHPSGTARDHLSDEAGRYLDERTKRTHRNQWSIETRDFVEERRALARTLADTTRTPQQAVASYPQLAGTYVALQEAELFAKQQLRDEDSRSKFLARIRERLVDDVEQGLPLDTGRLRDRQPSRTGPRRATPARDQELLRTP